MFRCCIPPKYRIKAECFWISFLSNANRNGNKCSVNKASSLENDVKEFTENSFNGQVSIPYAPFSR